MLTLPLLNREPDLIQPASLPSVLTDLLAIAKTKDDQSASTPLVGVTLNLTREDFENLDKYFASKVTRRYFNAAQVEDLKIPYQISKAGSRVVVLCQIPAATAQNLHYFLRTLGQSEAVKSAVFILAVVTVGYFTLMA